MDNGRTFKADQLSISTPGSVYPLQRMVICKALVDPLPPGGISLSLKKIKLLALMLLTKRSSSLTEISLETYVTA